MQIALNVPFLGTVSGSWQAWAQFLRWIWPKLALMVTGGAIIAGLFVFGPFRTVSSPAGTSASVAITAITGFGFRNLPTPVPYCDIFEGTGTIPAADKVLIFDQSLPNNNQPNPAQSFYYDGAANPSITGVGWQTPQMMIGAPGKVGAGKHIELLAVLVPKNLFHYVQSIFTPLNSWWKSSAPLPGLQAAKLDVVRNADTGCSL